MEFTPVLLSSSHLPHCEHSIPPVFLYYLLKIKMCLCGGGMGQRAGESSLEFVSILSGPEPMRFSRLASPFQSVLNKYLATSYLPGRLKDNTRDIISLRRLTMEFSVLCSLHLAAEATGRCLLVQPPQFLRQEDLGQGPGVQEQRPWIFPPRTELCPWEGGAELAGEEGGQ